MLQKIKRKCRPAVLLLITGFAISMASVLVGISMTEAVLRSAAEDAASLPVAQTMHNTGLSLAMSVYMFSVVNCAVTANYLVAGRTLILYGGWQRNFLRRWQPVCYSGGG